MKTIFTKKSFSSLKMSYKLQKLLSSPKIIGVVKKMETLIGIRIIKVELTNLSKSSTRFIQRATKNYQSQQKKSNFVCVSSSASAYNLTHNEISANIEKHQKLSEARWNDNLIEYICNH